MPDPTADSEALGANGTATPSGPALAELLEVWPQVNELGEMIMERDGQEIGRVAIMACGEGRIAIDRIRLEDGLGRQGHGSWALDRICAIADATGHDIILECWWDPRERDGGWLPRWYGSRGFEIDEDRDDQGLVAMLRMPFLEPKTAFTVEP